MDGKLQRGFPSAQFGARKPINATADPLVPPFGAMNPADPGNGQGHLALHRLPYLSSIFYIAEAVAAKAIPAASDRFPARAHRPINRPKCQFSKESAS